MSPLWRQTAVEMAAGIATGRFSAAQLVAAHLERAAEVGNILNCFTELFPGAVAQAEQIGPQPGRGAEPPDRAGLRNGAEPPDGARSPASLRGIPFAFKDLFVHAGDPPGAGSRRTELDLAAERSAVLARLAAAGAVAIGRLNLDPLAFAVTGINDEYGDTANPWARDRIAGGSSSGAAAAVAAGAVPFAVGSDTGGSVRIPSAFCGVVGLKPTLGRISKAGLLPLSFSQDTVGVIARSVKDIALALAALSGHDPADPVSIDAPVPDYLAGLEEGEMSGRSLAGLRAGFDRELVRRRCEPAVSEGIEAGMAVLEAAGAELVPIELGRLFAFDAAASVLTWAEVLAVHGRGLAEHPERYPATIRARLEIAMTAQGSDHVDAMRLQGRALDGLLSEELATVDLIVAPTVPAPAPARAGLDDEAAVLALAGRLLSLNRPFNFTGLPALSVPVGRDGDGLPLAVQLVGRPWDEATVLRAAAAIEAHFPFRFPEL